MSIIITVEEAQAKPKDFIRQLAPGDEIIITESQQAVAKLTGELLKLKQRPAPGLGKDSILFMANDFDKPVDEMKDYM